MPIAGEARKRVIDAVDTLARYNKSPFITDFIAQQAAPQIAAHRFDKEDLCHLVKQLMLDEYTGVKPYSVPVLEDLVRYLDRLQETGRQHVYIYELPESALAALRDVERLRTAIGDPDVFSTDGRLIWHSAGPAPAHVKFEPGRLMIKFVETREFWETQKPAIAADQGAGTVPTAITITKVKCDERAVSFFVADFEARRAELRLQELRSDARAARESQHRTYRLAVEAICGIELGRPVVIAPAIRRVLITGEVPIGRKSAVLPTGGTFRGAKHDLLPVPAQSLRAGATVSFEWRRPASGVGRVELDAERDEVTVCRPLVPEEHRQLIDTVLRWRKEGITGASHERPDQESIFDVARRPSGPEPEPDWTDLLKGALLRVPPKPMETTPAIDRAIVEYASTHLEIEGQAASPSAATDGGALKQFLKHIREAADYEESEGTRELKQVRRQEQVTFWLVITAMVLALAMVVTFTVLVVMGEIVLSIVTGLLGALTGGGTAMIRWYWSELRNKRLALETRMRDSQDTLLAIQAALAIPDVTARTEAMRQVATNLLARVTRERAATPPGVTAPAATV